MNLNRFQPRSIKARVTLFTQAIFLISVWSVALYATWMLRDDMQRMLGEQQFSVVSVLAADVNHELDDRLRALEKVAKKVTPALLADTAALQAFLEDRVTLQGLFNGGVIIYRRDGTAVADSLFAAGRIGVNYMDIGTVAAALKDGKSNIGQPVMGKKLGAPVFGMTAPIRDDQGKVTGAVAGVVNLGLPNFLDQIAQGRYGKTGGYLLVAPQYRVIVTASDKTRMMEKITGAGANPSVDRFIQGYEGSAVLTNPMGVNVLASAKGIPVAGWYLASVLPTAEAFAPIQDVQQSILLATTFLTLLIGALSWWILRQELEPMLVAVKTLATLAESDLPAKPLPITRQDEIGDLVGGFNHLLNILGQRASELQESQENLSITMQSIGDAVITTDEVGRVKKMNPTAEHLSGWTLSDAMGRPLSEVFRIINAFTRETVADPVQLVMTHGQVVGLANHTVLLARDGKEYQIADSAAPIRNAAQQIVGVVLVFSDVTARYLLEQDLHDSEQRYRQLVESTQDLITKVDVNGSITFVNRAARIVFGVDPKECVGVSTFEFVHPDDREATQKAFQGLLEIGTDVIKIENRLLSRDGAEHLMQWNLVADRTASGAVVGFNGVARDVTEMRRVEQELLHSRASLTSSLAMLEVMGHIAKIGGWSFDVASNTLWWSHETYRIHDMDGTRPIAMEQAVEFYAPQARLTIAEAVKHCIDHGQAYDLELPLVSATGRSIWVRAQGKAEMINGKTVRLLGAFQDITERELAQVTLKTSLMEKEALLKEVHHRVKNNLQVITSLLRLESRRSVHPFVKAVLGDMQGRIRTMALLHESLYRSDTLASVNLGAYLKEIGTQVFLTRQSQVSAIRLLLDLAPVMVGMDQALPCGLIINELISNCLKHGFPQGASGEVRVELHPQGAGTSLCLRVSDTGVGLGDDFEARRGNSLGLQLVSDLAGQLSGTLDIEPGPGAAFTVTFDADEPNPLLVCA